MCGYKQILKTRTFFATLLLIGFASCQTKKPTPFSNDAKWYSVYGKNKLPIIINDTILNYQVDTNFQKTVKTIDEYMEGVDKALHLQNRIKLHVEDSVIKYVEYKPDSATTFDTVTVPYELVMVDSIQLLKLGDQYLIPWKNNKNYGNPKIKHVEDFTTKLELAGYRIGQKIDDSKWSKTGEEINYTCGCPIGKYKNLLNKEVEAEAFNGYIIKISYRGFYESEAEEIKKLFKYHEGDTLKIDTDKESIFSYRASALSRNGNYLSIYKTEDYYVYGYLIRAGSYSAHLSNDNFLELLMTLESAKSTL